MVDQIVLEGRRRPCVVAGYLVGVQSFDVDGDGSQDVLHVGFGQSAVAAVAGVVGVGELVDRALGSGTGAVGALPLWILLVTAIISLQLVQVAGQGGDRAAFAGAGAAAPVRAWV